MVSMSDLAAVHASDAAARRLKKRKAAQARLQFYGIFAISLAALALIALLWSVVGKASGACCSSITLCSMCRLPPKRSTRMATGDPDVIRKADFTGLARQLVRDTFPYVTDRKTKKQLNDLVSVGAATELARPGGE